MKSLHRIVCSLVGALAVGISASSGADTVVSAPAALHAVTVENLQFDNGGINGEIVNRTQHRLEQIKLQVTYNWLWRNELKPGTDSPGWVGQLTVPATLAPGERYTFHYTPEQPLTPRDDGRFAPAVGVVSYTEFAGVETP